MGEVGSRVLDRVLNQKKSRTRLIWRPCSQKSWEHAVFRVLEHARVPEHEKRVPEHDCVITLIKSFLFVFGCTTVLRVQYRTTVHRIDTY